MKQMLAAILWSLVGHIQSRKARDIPGLFQVVHSVDRLKLATKLSQLMADADEPLDVLLEVNVLLKMVRGTVRVLRGSMR